MDEAPLLGGVSGPEDEMVTDLFGAESQFVSENLPLKTAGAAKHEDDEFRVFKDAYLGAADPKEPLLPAFSPPLGGDGKNPGKGELRGDEAEAQDLLGEYPSLPELQPLEDAVLPAAPQPPPAYNVHFLSSLLAPHRSPAVVPLGAWAREGAAQPTVRVIPVRPTSSQGRGGSRGLLAPSLHRRFPASVASRVGFAPSKRGASLPHRGGGHPSDKRSRLK